MKVTIPDTITLSFEFYDFYEDLTSYNPAPWVSTLDNQKL